MFHLASFLNLNNTKLVDKKVLPTYLNRGVIYFINNWPTLLGNYNKIRHDKMSIVVIFFDNQLIVKYLLLILIKSDIFTFLLSVFAPRCREKKCSVMNVLQSV